MNFKLGDRVVVVDNHNVSLSFNVGDKFTIIGINQNSNSVAIDGKNFYFDASHFKLDEYYYRKEKLEKIKSEYARY